MQVSINYHDDSALTVEEVVNLAHQNYGKSARVEVRADSPAPHDLIYFALQQIITHRQLSLLYDNKYTYATGLKELRSEVLLKLTELLDSVIIDNESRVV